jgi:aspartate/methionine/tyrosine aminotransferase
VAKLLIDEAQVGVTPGDAFGDVSTNHIRLSFANSDELIQKAVERIAQVFRG